MAHPFRVTLDFETRSRADLKKVGAWAYSRHPSTQAMCLAWRVGVDGERGLWHMGHPYKAGRLLELAAKQEDLAARSKKGDIRETRLANARKLRADAADLAETPPPTRLFQLVEAGYSLEAHNAFFERCIWDNVCVERMGWPAVEEWQWLCSAAKASMHSLPRDLARAAQEMCPERGKDLVGRKAMLKLARPAGPTKAEPAREWHEEPDDLRALWRYCEQDALAQAAVSASLQDLPPGELKLWRLDQRMNLRGWRCDLGLAKRALELRDRLLVELDREIASVTGGRVASTSSKDQVLAWLSENGVDGSWLVSNQGAENSLAKEALERARVRLGGAAARGTPVGDALAIVGAANKSSIAKYEAMLARADPVDHRLRDLLMYHGAGTGRWAGKGVQIHNFPRGGVKLMDVVCAALLDEELEYMLRGYWTPTELMGVLSDALRGALTATPGRLLYVADYAAIEARVVFWLADCAHALDVFRRGMCIYRDMASTIYKMAYEAVLKDSEHRRMGKQAILGLGYQMGAPKFWDTIAGYEPAYKGVHGGQRFSIPMEPSGEMLRRLSCHRGEIADKIKFGHSLDDREWGLVVETERRTRGGDAAILMDYFLFVREVVQVYRRKYGDVKSMWDAQNAACVEAVKTRRRVREGKMEWYVEDGFLRCRLPSGRDLFYRRPEVRTNKFDRDAVFYWAIDAVNHQWRLTGTYGGKVVENQTQGVARDLMAHGMVMVDEHPTYDLLGSIHDEGVAEADEGAGDLDEYLGLVTHLEPWAEGIPVEAEGWCGFRYKKA